MNKRMKTVVSVSIMIILNSLSLFRCNETLRANYKILNGLSNAETKLRGIGKCRGYFFMLFDKPVYYKGTNEIVYDMKFKYFRVINLFPKLLFSYTKATMKLICPGGADQCEKIDPNLYFSIYKDTQSSHCNIVLVRDRKLHTSVSMLDVDNNFEVKTIENRDVGIPFSNLDYDNPGLRFVFYGNFRVYRKACNLVNFSQLGSYYKNLDDCLGHVIDSEEQKVDDYLTVPIGIGRMPDLQRGGYNEKMFTDQSLRFGFAACIDTFYLINAHEDTLFSTEGVQEHVYDYFGYKHYRLQTTREETYEKLFSGEVHSPEDEKTTMSDGERRSGTFFYPIVVTNPKDGSIYTITGIATFFVRVAEALPFYIRYKQYIFTNIFLILFFLILCVVTNRILSSNEKIKNVFTKMNHEALRRQRRSPQLKTGYTKNTTSTTFMVSDKNISFVSKKGQTFLVLDRKTGTSDTSNSGANALEILNAQAKASSPKIKKEKQK